MMRMRFGLASAARSRGADAAGRMPHEATSRPILASIDFMGGARDRAMVSGVGGLLLALAGLALAAEGSLRRWRPAVIALVSAPPGNAQAPHLGERQGLHLREPGRVPRVAGEFDLALP